MNYKGYKIEIIPNGSYFACHVYKNDKPVKGTFDADKDNAICKAIIKIELLLLKLKK